MLSQFTDRGTLAGGGEGARATQSDYIDVPGVYPAGRLERDSDGLLILTDDGALQGRISAPEHTTPQTYLAQVEDEPNVASLDRLPAGVMLNDAPPRPATVCRIDPPQMWDRDPPVRYRQRVPGKHGSSRRVIAPIWPNPPSRRAVGANQG